MDERIYTATQEALASLGVPGASFAVEWPADLAHGDYAVNAALVAAKPLGKPPREVAELLLPKLQEALGSDVVRIEVAGPGFINISLSYPAIARQLAQARGQEWGTNARSAGRRVMIEYGNPNPFKEMHIGHVMGAVIGESVSRLIESAGATTLRDTFGGDVGPQVAKALWSLQRKGETDVISAAEIGAAYMHGATAYEESEEAKAEIDALNVRVYDLVGRQAEAAAFSEDDRALLYLWQKGREVSMEEFGRIFSLLGTRFDYTFFDSDTTAPGVSAVREGLAHGVFEESEGAVVYKGEKAGLFTLVFITSRGNPTYETKDIGLAILKEERTATDEIIILTAVEQIGHFKVVLAALGELMPAVAAKMSHMAHGLLTLTTGKMSSRKGNVITGAELIRDLTLAASERNPDPLVAEQVAVGALKYFILRSAPGGNVVFDPEKALSLEGDSGPYLQYALVRAQSILEKATARPAFGEGEQKETPPVLARLIARYPEAVAKAQTLRGPHVLVQYLTQLAGEWNSYYARERILGEPDEAQKLATVRAFVQTMQNGLGLLGIPTPEKM